jgi:ATP-binding protein involved in chromosome partitioning
MPTDLALASQVRTIAESLPDPELGLTLGELKMIREVTVTTGQVSVLVALTTPGCPLKNQIKTSLIDALGDTELGGRSVAIAFTELTSSEKEYAMQRARSRAQDRATTPLGLQGTQLLAFSSGKGGVGKSSIAVALANNIARRGYRVGLLDADIWGFSQPQLLEATNERLQADGDPDHFQIKPYRTTIGSGTLAVVSMGMMVEQAGSAIMWRGLMLSRALQHFIEDVDWDNPDFLIIDLPPGTGDIPMTLARLLPATKVALVTTPSPLASHVAERAASFAIKANLSLLGVIENMSSLVCPHGEVLTPFGAGGGAHIAATYAIPLLASLPLAPSLEEQGAMIELTSRILEEMGRQDDQLASCTAHLWDAVTAP